MATAHGKAPFCSAEVEWQVVDKAEERFVGAGLEKGTYQAALIMYSNDPEQPITRLPLQLEVN